MVIFVLSLNIMLTLNVNSFVAQSSPSTRFHNNSMSNSSVFSCLYGNRSDSSFLTFLTLVAKRKTSLSKCSSDLQNMKGIVFIKLHMFLFIFEGLILKTWRNNMTWEQYLQEKIQEMR